MNLLEYDLLINEAIQKLKFMGAYTSNMGDTPYDAQNLNLLRQLITKIEKIPFIDNEIQIILNSWLFKINSDSVMLSSSDNSAMENLIKTISIKLSVLRDINHNSGLIDQEDLLFIKLPELTSFEDLAKYSNDLKKAIELPVLDPSIAGNVKIIGADQGSVILYATLGTVLAVKLIAGICWAAVLLKKKNAEANMFIAHAKTLELKNESLQNIVEMQNQQVKNILQAEAEAIATKHYNHNDPETLERLKLSITTVAELVEKGAKILPMHNNDDIQKSFPDYNATNLIESSIRQLRNE